MLSWDKLDWTILDRLRDGFLHGGAADGPYWKSHDDLAHYDFTYGERIGWKWDAVLRELRQRGWRPPEGLVLDWGCGSGVAGRRFARAWPEIVRALQVWDHSPLARQFALERARAELPQLDLREWSAEAPEPIGTLVISHVLNELHALSRGELTDLIGRANAVVWIEPGTSAVARMLVEWREQWREKFRIVLPCPHQGTCGLLAAGNERHWCHHFAAPPAGIFADSNWVRFGQRAGIDLRSLPYAVLVLERHELPALAPLPDDASRVVGRPEVFKPYARLLNCEAAGVTELMLPKRVDPRLYRTIDRSTAPRLWRWTHDGRSIRLATPLLAESESAEPERE